MKVLVSILILSTSIFAQNRREPANKNETGASQQTNAREEVKTPNAIVQDTQPTIQQPEPQKSQQPGYKDEQVADNTTVWIGIGLNALLFLVVIAQGYISKRQLNAMEKQTQLATDTLQHSKNSFHIAERAYLGIKSVKFLWPIAADKRAAIGFCLVNAGRTPAWNVRSVIKLVIHKIPLAKVVEAFPSDMSVAPLTGVFLPAGSERSLDFPEVSILITPEHLDAIDNGAMKLSAYGEIHYTDFSDSSQIFYVRISYNPEQECFAEIENETATHI